MGAPLWDVSHQHVVRADVGAGGSKRAVELRGVLRIEPVVTVNLDGGEEQGSVCSIGDADTSTGTPVRAAAVSHAIRIPGGRGGRLGSTVGLRRF